MQPTSTAFRIDPEHEAKGSGDDLRTRLLLGLIQIGLAIVFVPVAILILIVVGVFMIVEWTAFRGGRAIRSCSRPAPERPGNPTRTKTAATHTV
jgi:hypothetical protein